MTSEAEWSKGFAAGKNSVLRKNASGCCCKTDEDGNEIVGLCMMHREYCDAAVVEALERAVQTADSWGKADCLKLHCGEMSAQELRTAIAVAKGIAAAIRALKPRSDLVCVPESELLEARSKLALAAENEAGLTELLNTAVLHLRRSTSPAYDTKMESRKAAEWLLENFPLASATAEAKE